jgi:hypothetical protein
VKAATKALPLARPYLDEREEELVLEVLRSGRLSLGPAIERFEQLVAERVGAPFAAAVSSGTAGLHLLAHLAGIGPGDEVITSSFTFVAAPAPPRTFSFNGSGSTAVAPATITSYDWDFGDLTAPGTGQVVNHTYAIGFAGTSVVVRLVVTDSAGRTNASSQVVSVP